MKQIRFKFLFGLTVLAFNTYAADNVLRVFEEREKKTNSSFTAFSIAQGEKIFRSERVNSKGEKVSCMTCHTANPKAEGLTRANKVIAPLAPAANQERFTDIAKVEKWFKRNCKDVLDRECTNTEKGHFTAWILSVK
jgi:hypothetical protein